MFKFKNEPNVVGCVLRGVVMFVGVATAASAQTKPWTTVGSAGTVDEGDVPEIRYVLGEAQMNPAAGVGTVSTIRYNVVAVDSVIGLGVPRFTIRYRTGDSTGRVIVRLRRYNFNPGAAAALVFQFDSAAHPATGGGYVTRTLTGCAAPSFNFVDNAYFVEVEMQKNGANGTPGLGTVKLDTVSLCVP